MCENVLCCEHTVLVVNEITKNVVEGNGTNGEGTVVWAGGWSSQGMTSWQKVSES